MSFISSLNNVGLIHVIAMIGYLLRRHRPVLLTFLKYLSSIRSVIYTTNWIERTIKDILKRLKPMNSLLNIKAAEKIVYLTIQSLNETCSERKLRGFASGHCVLQDMFIERYGV